MITRNEKFKILLLGAGGLMGSSVAIDLSSKNHTLYAPNKTECNLLNLENLKSIILNFSPTHIINCAGYTNVDAAEKKENSKNLFEINVELVKFLSAISLSKKISLYHISTASVFNSKKIELIPNDHNRNPVNNYNISKVKSELIVESYLRDGAKIYTFRPYWLYGIRKDSFINHLLRAVAENKKMQIVADQYGQPTFVEEVSKMIIKILEEQVVEPGFYPATSKGITNRIDWAKTVFTYFGADHNLIEPVNSSDYDALARRPFNCALDHDELTKNQIFMTEWDKSILKYLEKYYPKNKL